MFGIRPWPITEMCGYQPKTTFWQDFCIADFAALEGDNKRAIEAINDTFERAFAEWKSDIVYLTELAMVVNWKGFEFDERNNREVCEAYVKLWKKVDGYCMTKLKDDDLRYYLKTTD